MFHVKHYSFKRLNIEVLHKNLQYSGSPMQVIVF